MPDHPRTDEANVEVKTSMTPGIKFLFLCGLLNLWFDQAQDLEVGKKSQRTIQRLADYTIAIDKLKQQVYRQQAGSIRGSSSAASTPQLLQKVHFYALWSQGPNPDSTQ
ncbi:MAG: hypothetical protein HKN85_05195 [Gammaproteobacteria bacterium]|nr:hypothetical protein [Gammaproteobacteria bacterium]